MRSNRSKSKPSVRLGRRGYAILRFLFLQRVCTRDQLIAALAYTGKNVINHTNERLAQLCKAGYIERLPPYHLFSDGMSLYCLRTKGRRAFLATLTAEQRDRFEGRDSRLSERTLRHTLWLTEVRLTFHRAQEDFNFKVEKWLPERLIQHQFRYADTDSSFLIKPDAFVRFRRDDQVSRTVFIEVDLDGNVGPARMKERMAAYKEYRASATYGAFEAYRDAAMELAIFTNCGTRRIRTLQKLASVASGLTVHVLRLSKRTEDLLPLLQRAPREQVS